MLVAHRTAENIEITRNKCHAAVLFDGRVQDIASKIVF